jgi:DNA-binding MarR family transcriptional regulator
MAGGTQLVLDRYVVDVLLQDLVGHDQQPSAFVVYLFLETRAHGTPAIVRISIRALAERTGLSKSAVQTALMTLLRRDLIRRRFETDDLTPTYEIRRHWRARERRRQRDARRSRALSR